MKNNYHYPTKTNYKLPDYKKNTPITPKSHPEEEPASSLIQTTKQALQNLKTKLILCAIKEALITEKNKSYYRNSINIKEELLLNQESTIDQDGITSVTSQYLVTYQNNYQDFYSLTRKKF